MALKDKLMTLEDFKAVRDVDVASNSAQFTEIKADLGDMTRTELTFTTGKYINTGGSGVNIGDTINVSSPSSYATLKYAIAECSEGDRFLLNIKGAASGRAWAFLTSANVLISRADASVTLTDFYITAPANAAKIVINDNFEQGTTGGTAYKITGGDGNFLRFDVAQSKTDEEKAIARANLGISSADGLTEDIKQALLNCFKHVYFKDGDDGYYKALEIALYPSLPDPLYDWDFTESLTDKVSGQVAVLKKNTKSTANPGTLPTRGANGVHFSGYGQSIQLFGDEVTLEQSLKGKTLQVDVLSFVPSSNDSRYHVRFIMFSKSQYDIANEANNVGIIYRQVSGQSQWNYFTCAPSAESGSWGNGFGIADRTAISGHTVSIYIGNDYKPKLYIDRKSYGTGNLAFYPDLVGLFIGNNDYATGGATFYDAIVTGARIYEGDVYNGL